MLQMIKKKLTPEQYRQYKIDPEVEAYEIFYSQVIEERCDQFEYEYESEGYEIIDRELIPIATSIFNFRLVIAYEHTR